MILTEEFKPDSLATGVFLVDGDVEIGNFSQQVEFEFELYRISPSV